MSPPSNYSAELPRVSQIVEYFFPFSWDWKQRFLNWLENKSILLTDYMEEASSGGTYVHSKLEDYMNWIEFKGKKYKGFVESWIQFLKDKWVVPIWMEVYFRTSKFQWTIDLIWEIDWEKWILDWKTYWLAKYKFNLPIGAYKKPYDKLKKARLQLSLYAMVKRIKRIWVIELTPTGYHFHELTPYTRKELMWMVKEFTFHYIDQL